MLHPIIPHLFNRECHNSIHFTYLVDLGVVLLNLFIPKIAPRFRFRDDTCYCSNGLQVGDWNLEINHCVLVLEVQSLVFPNLHFRLSISISSHVALLLLVDSILMARKFATLTGNLGFVPKPVTILAQ